MVICPNDDSAACCGKCGIEPRKKITAAIIPVHGRLPLLKYTISRLLNKNKVDHVICVGASEDERKVCEEAGATFIEFENYPLAKKWNAGFVEARKFSPDACVFVGSSDWLSDNWLEHTLPHTDKFDMIGLPGCYFMDMKKAALRRTEGAVGLRACFWAGYDGQREGESIGIGRIISARILDKLNWMPFHDHLDRSLDHSMQGRILEKGGKIKLLFTEDIKSVSISTDLWPNKHQFEQHYSGMLPSIKIENAHAWAIDNFPESKLIFNAS